MKLLWKITPEQNKPNDFFVFFVVFLLFFLFFYVFFRTSQTIGHQCGGEAVMPIPPLQQQSLGVYDTEQSTVAEVPTTFDQ